MLKPSVFNNIMKTQTREICITNINLKSQICKIIIDFGEIIILKNYVSNRKTIINFEKNELNCQRMIEP